MTTNFARENNASRASIDETIIFAEGAFKNVYKGTYTEGERKGEECVCKEFKTGSVFEESYFNNELKVVAKALAIINQFNKDGVITKGIWLNQPAVWTDCSESKKKGTKCLIEPMIANLKSSTQTLVGLQMNHHRGLK
jgi:hypothetical protein